jgi:hypothetical protein
MSAPQTNLERQKRRHAGPILGSVLVVCFALGLFFAYTTFIVSEGQTPEASAPVADQSTVDVVPVD